MGHLSAIPCFIQTVPTPLVFLPKYPLPPISWHIALLLFDKVIKC